MDDRCLRGRRRARTPQVLHILVALAALGALAGCAEPPPRATRSVWIFGAAAPPFDPGGPPDPRRWALERELSYGLIEQDSSGRIVSAAAQSFEVSSDSLVYTFHLPDGLRFADGTPCRSADFAAALTAPLARADHATRAWQLAAVRGVERVRSGRPLPELGVATPDDRTVTLSLAVRDPELLRKLAIPGTSTAWKRHDVATWHDAVGLGPFRVAREDSAHRLLLVRVPGLAAAGHADTLLVRFMTQIARVRGLLRSGLADLVWPLPPGLLGEPVPGAYEIVAREAHPARRLVLVQRADLPPTTRLAARAALAYGINYPEIVRALGDEGGEVRAWISGGGPYDYPALDPGEIELWRQRGKLGRSFHVAMTYDATGPAAPAARLLQGEWAAHAIYVELAGLVGAKLYQEQLRGRSHLVLAETQDLIDSPSGALAPLVMPVRGPAVGAIRTGWRTREFDGWIDPRARAGRPDAEAIQRRLEEERIVLPLASLPWVWVERTGLHPAHFHPALGPSCWVPGAERRAR